GGISSENADGSGGSVTVKAAGTTDFTGTITATGSGKGKNGGSAEVSGGGLDFKGKVDLTPGGGANGTLLLYPEAVIIQATGPSTTTPAPGSFTGDVPSSVLAVSDLQAALNTSNVVVQTGAGGTQAGDININASITWGGGSKLTFKAFRNIVVA